MRALGAIGGFVAGLGVLTSALAADLAVEQGGYGGYGYDGGQIVIWDAEPGVVLRTWWAPPWRDRHYFPSSGEKPDIGRDEDLSQRSTPQAAQSYRRSWSASSANPGMPLTPPMNFAPEILVQPSLRWR